MSSQLLNNLTVNLAITGKVQGVDFRYFVLRHAQELGINGWVSNKSKAMLRLWPRVIKRI